MPNDIQLKCLLSWWRSWCVMMMTDKTNIMPWLMNFQRDKLRVTLKRSREVLTHKTENNPGPYPAPTCVIFLCRSVWKNLRTSFQIEHPCPESEYNYFSQHWQGKTLKSFFSTNNLHSFSIYQKNISGFLYKSNPDTHTNT